MALDLPLTFLAPTPSTASAVGIMTENRKRKTVPQCKTLWFFHLTFGACCVANSGPASLPQRMLNIASCTPTQTLLQEGLGWAQGILHY